MKTDICICEAKRAVQGEGLSPKGGEFLLLLNPFFNPPPLLVCFLSLP